MRTAPVLLTLALITGEVGPSIAQTLPADVGAGRIAWSDLSTTDRARSSDFYGQLLDWRFNPLQGTDLAVEIVAGGVAIGTLRVADGPISVFNGVVYVQVTDLPGSCEKAKALGGTIAPGFPFNLPGGTGAIALLVDPGGHPIGLYSRTPLTATAPR
jgi:predicted enzyme related to lactoylglutathione lyase